MTWFGLVSRHILWNTSLIKILNESQLTLGGGWVGEFKLEAQLSRSWGLAELGKNFPHYTTPSSPPPNLFLT